MTMEYTHDRTWDIFQDTTIYLNLTKEKRYEVDLIWNESEVQTINPGDNVTYTLTIKNNGNVKDTFGIDQTTNELWNFTLINNVILDIGESTTFDVTINASEDAKVEHEKITIAAQSRGLQIATDEVELLVNITPVFLPANLTYNETKPVAIDNTLDYKIRITTVGNAVDNFTLSLSGVPSDWNATLSPTTADLLGPGDTQQSLLFITIPYNSTFTEAEITVISISRENETSELKIPVSFSNLKIEESDLTVTGEGVTEGPIDDSPIPGFEALALLASLFGVAVLMKRRRIK
jgi:uncharacterized membrane protein